MLTCLRKTTKDDTRPAGICSRSRCDGREYVVKRIFGVVGGTPKTQIDEIKCRVCGRTRTRKVRWTTGRWAAASKRKDEQVGG